VTVAMVVTAAMAAEGLTAVHPAYRGAVRPEGPAASPTERPAAPAPTVNPAEHPRKSQPLPSRRFRAVAAALILHAGWWVTLAGALLLNHLVLTNG